MAGLLVVELALNIAGVRVVALLNQISVWWHIFFVIVIALALFILGTKSTEADAGLQLFAMQHAFALGDLQASQELIQDVIGNRWSVGAAVVIR